MTLSGVTTWGQSEIESDGDEGVLFFLQSSSITEATPSDCFVSYLGHSLGNSYSSAEMQPMYLAAKADWASFQV